MEISDKAATVGKATTGVLAITVGKEAEGQMRADAKGVVDRTMAKMTDVGTDATDCRYWVGGAGPSKECQNWAVG